MALGTLYSYGYRYKVITYKLLTECRKFQGKFASEHSKSLIYESFCRIYDETPRLQAQRPTKPWLFRVELLCTELDESVKFCN